MRSLSTTGLPAELVQLTAHLALEAQPVAGPADRPWSVPLLVTPEAEAWLLGWPAGLVTTAHDHGDATVAVSVVEGALSEECLDPTIWTTGRRTTWRAGATTVFPPGHVHLLGAAGDRPAADTTTTTRADPDGLGGVTSTTRAPATRSSSSDQRKPACGTSA